MSNLKVIIILLTVGFIKKISLYKMSYFPEPYTRRKSKIKVELDLSNYATKSNLKNKISVDISHFAKKTDLPNLKADVDKLDIGKLKYLTSNASNLKSKVRNLDADKLVPVPVLLKAKHDVKNYVKNVCKK